MLVLKGPPGSGKTATIKLLAEAMECDVSEWTNPVGADYTSEGYLSWSAKFDDFMARSGRYPTLSMDNEMDESPARAASSALNQVGKKDRKIILIEEFPSLAGNPLASLSSFRTSILQHLAHAGAAAGSTDSHPDTPSVIPIVTIISEDHIGVSTSFCDSFTVMRILGPDIVHHARVAVIEFNPVAPTFLSKALGSAIQRENKQAGRNISVGLELLKKLSTSGDIRSAFGSLEFLSLGGQYCGEYSNSRPASVRSSKLTRKSGASSKIGAESDRKSVV